ncbi:SpoIIE family protein phosphatase [Actinomadura sp. NBRC 104425]|uniref:SpoIIE family protein phosphatase n=1 Tax=Actinomadura sp. NBRC 104425 TaxID=3032204 RepID=UPI002557BB5E|nr:SpoIIE family protein phosphatase [Actinomadura sp. NBRC 104425]
MEIVDAGWKQPPGGRPRPDDIAGQAGAGTEHARTAAGALGAGSSAPGERRAGGKGPRDAAPGSCGETASAAAKAPDETSGDAPTEMQDESSSKASGETPGEAAPSDAGPDGAGAAKPDCGPPDESRPPRAGGRPPEEQPPAPAPAAPAAAQEQAEAPERGRGQGAGDPGESRDESGEDARTRGSGRRMPMLQGMQAAARQRAVIAEARVRLADRLGCQPGEALQHLIWLARDLGMDLEETASLLVGERPAARETGGDPYAVVRETALRARSSAGREDVDPMVVVEELLGRPITEDAEADADLLAATPDDPVARAVLDAAIVSAAWLVPVRSPEERVVDFVYAALNEQAKDPFGRGVRELRGRRLLRADPGVVLSGLFAAHVDVLETGRPFSRGPFWYTTSLNGTSRTMRVTVRSVRVPTGICMVWRFHDEEERTARRLEQAERLARIGFAEWDVATGEQDWSPQMLANYGRTEQDGPVTLKELSQVVVPEDLPLAEEALHTVLDRREPVQYEHRIRTPDGERRHLWLYAEPVLDSSGLLVGVRMLTQDISHRRSLEGALAETRRDLLRLQGQSARERQVALALRRAILPPDLMLAGASGLRAAVRSIPAENTARIGGDWHVTRVLSDGRGLFAVGDCSGHGLAATADMARMRHGLLALSYTGESAGRLMGWLNDLANDLEPTATGTAVIAHFEPETCRMKWSIAGHPPPLLVRDGRARLLDDTPDPLLGAFPRLTYRTITTQLQPGDLVVLYTDGLVERRDSDLDEQIDRLARIVEKHDGEPDRLLDLVLTRMGYDPFADDTTLFIVRVA